MMQDNCYKKRKIGHYCEPITAQPNMEKFINDMSYKQLELINRQQLANQETIHTVSLLLKQIQQERQSIEKSIDRLAKLIDESTKRVDPSVEENLDQVTKKQYDYFV